MTHKKQRQYRQSLLERQTALAKAGSLIFCLLESCLKSLLSSKLQVKMGLDTVTPLGDGLDDTLRITSLELAREKRTEPTFRSSTIPRMKKGQTHQP
jgi:hypothetical protein